jgi:transcriptional regulator with XRE-family HTH domain
MIVGPELRRRRLELGLSLRELAEASELSTGFLSQLENDQVSPSLASLERICTALRMPVFELLSSDERDPVVRADRRPVRDLGTTGAPAELLTNFDNWQMLPFRRTLAVGEKYEAVRIERAREEWMYVLSGAAEIYLRGQDAHRLEPGDSIHFASSRLEAVDSVGAEPLELICLMTPPAF